MSDETEVVMSNQSNDIDNDDETMSSVYYAFIFIIFIKVGTPYSESMDLYVDDCLWQPTSWLLWNFTGYWVGFGSTSFKHIWLVFSYCYYYGNINKLARMIYVP